MRKFLITAAVVASAAGLAACGDNVDENATGAIDDPALTTEPAIEEPAAPAEDPMVDPVE